MSIPQDRHYIKEHIWVQFTNETAKIGLTDHAQRSLGEIVYATLPAVGETVTAGQALGDVESAKSVSDVISPVSGTVVAVNSLLEDAPNTINADPYATWLVEIQPVTAKGELLTPEQYESQAV